MATIRQSIADKNMLHEQAIKKLEQEKRKQYENIDKLIGKKRE